MIREIVGKEVKIILPINAEQGDKVGRVHAISKQFESHAWSHVRRLSVRRGSVRQANVARVSAAEHASVRVTSLTDPLSLSNSSVWMDHFLAAASEATLQLVTGGVKNRLYPNKKGTTKVGFT